MGKHAEFSASGSERWLNCAGSIKLSRTVPKPPESVYAAEGTEAHGYLERWAWHWWVTGGDLKESDFPSRDMYLAVKKAMDFIKKRIKKNSQLLIEKRVSLDFVYSGMFGTTDIGIVHPGEELEVWDYKHGAGVPVDIVTQNSYGESPNTQIAYYGLGLAHEYDYDFYKVRLGIIQPRAKHKSGQTIRSYTMPMRDLKAFESFFRKGVQRALSANAKFFEGKWCHWCPAKSVCPLKQNKKYDKIKDMF